MHRDFIAEIEERVALTFDLWDENGDRYTYRVKREVAPENLVVFEDFRASTEDNEQSRHLLDSAVKVCLWPEDHRAWDGMRQLRGEKEVGVATLVAVFDFVMEVVTGRPPSPPSPSSAGPPAPETGTTSTDESSSPEVVASLA